MALRRRVCTTVCVSTLIFLLCSALPVHAQAPRPVNFLADNYDVSATLDAIGQSITATARIEFKAAEASSSLRVELHPNLIVREVKVADGKQLSFERDNQNPLFVVVQLLSPVASGGHVTLTFTYAGLLANAENSPVPGVRAALIDRDGAYLLLPSRWFPLTNFPSTPSNAKTQHPTALSWPAIYSLIRSRRKESTSPFTHRARPPGMPGTSRRA